MEGTRCAPTQRDNGLYSKTETTLRRHDRHFERFMCPTLLGATSAKIAPPSLRAASVIACELPDDTNSPPPPTDFHVESLLTVQQQLRRIPHASSMEDCRICHTGDVAAWDVEDFVQASAMDRIQLCHFRLAVASTWIATRTSAWI